jgi:hypothetical protein
MGAQEFAYVSAANRAGATSLGVWDRLGPVTKQVFQAFPQVRPASRSAAAANACGLASWPQPAMPSSCVRRGGVSPACFINICLLVVWPCPPQEGKAWVEAVLARGGSWDTVIPAHATAPIPDGHRAFRECFDFLYR